MQASIKIERLDNRSLKCIRSLTYILVSVFICTCSLQFAKRNRDFDLSSEIIFSELTEKEASGFHGDSHEESGRNLSRMFQMWKN